MNEREALVSFFKDAEGALWEKNANWQSDERFGKWHGIIVDISGHIERLHLNDNRLQGRIHDSKHLKCFINMKSLNLSSNMLSGHIPSNIYLISSLQEINLSWNRLSGEIPEEIFALTDLRLIKLDNNHFSGTLSASIKKLVKLKFLDISCNKLTGILPDVTGCCSELQVIDLSRNFFQGK